MNMNGCTAIRDILNSHGYESQRQRLYCDSLLSADFNILNSNFSMINSHEYNGCTAIRNILNSHDFMKVERDNVLIIELVKDVLLWSIS